MASYIISQTDNCVTEFAAGYVFATGYCYMNTQFHYAEANSVSGMFMEYSADCGRTIDSCYNETGDIPAPEYYGW